MNWGPEQPPNAAQPGQLFPPPGAPPGWPPHIPPVVIDVGSTMRTKALIGAAVSIAIGLLALVSMILGAVDGGGGAVIAVGVIGAIFLLIGLLPVLMWRKVSRPRTLVFEQRGLRWDDPQGRPWAVPWPEVGAVAISRTVQRRVQLHQYLIPRKIMVRLDVFPADVGFRQRHPEMAHLWEFHRVKNGYRLPLGSNPKFIPLIDHGMRQFQPRAYRGVVDEGFVVGIV